MEDARVHRRDHRVHKAETNTQAYRQQQAACTEADLRTSDDRGGEHRVYHYTGSHAARRSADGTFSQFWNSLRVVPCSLTVDYECACVDGSTDASWLSSLLTTDVDDIMADTDTDEDLLFD